MHIAKIRKWNVGFFFMYSNSMQAQNENNVKETECLITSFDRVKW